MAAEFAGRGWRVVGTIRGAETPLHALAAERPDAIEVEKLDITDHDQIRSLRRQLAGRPFDVVFINAGIVNRRPTDTMADVPTDEFVQV
ncbi:MAG: 3-oxoacyl-ACP reductase, partial [Proteobacteria bacterium]|nr:3-oxoacyl-ACP reductase [Pseudomonadota bacterium]